jgi:hypothetical protein
MSKNSMFLASLLVMAQFAAVMGQWVEPNAMEEVHFKEASGHYRFTAVGMTADEKAGLTAGFALTWFLVVVLFILVSKTYSIALKCQAELEAYRVANELAKAQAEL